MQKISTLLKFASVSIYHSHFEVWWEHKPQWFWFFFLSKVNKLLIFKFAGHFGGKGADVPKSLADLFFGAVATNHPGGQFHGVVLVFIMAHVTGVGSAAAGKPESRQTFTFIILTQHICVTWQGGSDTLTIDDSVCNVCRLPSQVAASPSVQQGPSPYSSQSEGGDLQTEWWWYLGSLSL